MSRRVPLTYGVSWFAAGWRGFANAPGLLIGVLLLWFIILVALGMIPLLGSLISSLIGPALFGGYLLMSRAALENRAPSLEQFFAGLTRRECLGDVLVLGLVLLIGHVVALILTTAAFLLFSLVIVGGIPWEVIEQMRTGSPGDVTITIGMFLVLSLTLMVALVPYAVLTMALTYAAPLVLENRSSALTALGLSFNACLRNILPLGLFALVYLVLAILAAIPLGLGLLIFLPVSLAALARSYADIFPPTEPVVMSEV